MGLYSNNGLWASSFVRKWITRSLKNIFNVQYFGRPQSAIDWEPMSTFRNRVSIKYNVILQLTSNMTQGVFDVNYRVSTWMHLSAYLDLVWSSLWKGIRWFFFWSRFCIFVQGSSHSSLLRVGALLLWNEWGRVMHCLCYCVPLFVWWSGISFVQHSWRYICYFRRKHDT